MKKHINIYIFALCVLILVTGTVLVFLRPTPKPSGVLVHSIPESDIFIDGKLVGKTPYQGTFVKDAVILKMVPASASVSFSPFETKLSLFPGTQTVVRKEFGQIEDESSLDIISFDKESLETTSLVITSYPDNSQVFLDGILYGSTPLKTTRVAQGERRVEIRAEGHVSKSMVLNLYNGYRLTLSTKLAKSKPVESTTQAEVSETEISTYVEILETPTGFLRVRNAPGNSGEEIAEVVPGSRYKFLERDSNSGWYKIQYQEARPGLPEGITGWVSNQYSKITEQ